MSPPRFSIPKRKAGGNRLLWSSAVLILIAAVAVAFGVGRRQTTTTPGTGAGNAGFPDPGITLQFNSPSVQRLPPGEGWGLAGTYARGVGASSSLRFWHHEGSALLRLRGEAFTYRRSPAQTIDVLLNGRWLARRTLLPWPRTLQVRLPASGLKPRANNQVTIRYRWSIQPSRLFEASEDHVPLAAKWYAVDVISAPGTYPAQLRGEDLHFRAGTYFDFYADGKETLEFRAEAVEGPQLELLVENDDGVMARRLAQAGDGPIEWRLPQWDGPIRLRLVHRDRGPGTTVVRRPRLAVEPPERLTAPNRAREQGVAERSQLGAAVLVVIDTLRADRLRTYGGDVATPCLDRIAQRGLVYDNARAQSSWTRTSVASILTGRFAHQHGVYGRDHALARDTPTLAARLHSAGYRTAAVISNGNLQGVGLDQGFDSYEHLPEGGTDIFHRPAHEIVDRGLDWLHQRDPLERFFLYLHVTDPHAPYVPTSAFRPPAPSADLGALNVVAGLAGEDTPPIAAILALYDAEIRQVDDALCRLEQGLRQRGRWTDTLMIVTADHGEEFRDHGGWQHGQTLYAEQLRVPLVLRGPGVPAGREEMPAQHVDIAPTILEAAGVEVRDTLSGRSLVRVGSRQRFTLSELRLDGRCCAALVGAGYKLVRCYDSAGRELVQLFDPNADPADARDLTGDKLVTAGYLLHSLRVALTAAPEPRSSTPVKQDQGTRESLRALGYL